MRKKAPALIALLMLAASLLSSCSFVTVNFDKIFPYEGTLADSETESESGAEKTDTEHPADTSGDTVSEYVYTGLDEAKELLSSVHGYDFGAVSVFINTTATDDIGILTSDFDDSTEIDKNDYSAAVYERNRMVEEKLNCSIRYRRTTLDEMRADIKSAIKKEEYYSDLLCVGASELAVLAKDGYLYNLRSLPFFELEQKYFNASAANALSAGYFDYGVISTATIDPDEISAVFVNLDAFVEVLDVPKQISDFDVEALAENGEWTWDKLIELAAGSAISYSGTNGEFVDVIAASGGVSYVSNEKNKTPEAVLTDGASSALEAARKFFVSANVLSGDENGKIDAFTSKKSTFHIGTLSDMRELPSVDFDWTVLPIPKISSEQTSYLSYMDADTLAYAVPVTTTDAEGAGALISAISAASYAYMRDVYVKYQMYHTVRVSSALDMIELIWDTPYFDFAHTLGAVSDDIADGTYMMLREAATDDKLSLDKLFKKHKSAANKALKKYYAPKW